MQDAGYELPRVDLVEVDLPPALAEEGPVERDQGILLPTDSTAGR
jgi:hypothetical protein